MSVQIRTYYPGSEWLYLKIYTGVTSSEKVIINALFPFANFLLHKKMISKWFFIRYADPDFHIRFRVLLCDKKFIGNVMLLFNKRILPYCKNKLIYKIEISTYEREMERYGFDSIEQTESIFFVDSDAVCRILKSIQNTNPNFRWMIAFKLIDSFFESFDLSLEAKILILSELDKSYKAEFGYNEYNVKQLNMLYRNFRNQIDAVMGTNYLCDCVAKLSNILYRREENIRQIIKAGNNVFNISPYVHITMNRIFQSDARKYELVIYDFLRRYYNSLKARMVK